MKLSSSPYQRWLAAERDNDDAAADAAFARLLSQLPRVEANPDFAARTARAAWHVRARARLVTRLGRLTVVALGVLAITGVTLAARLAALLGGFFVGAPLGAVGYLIEYAAWTVGLGASILAWYSTRQHRVPAPTVSPTPTSS